MPVDLSLIHISNAGTDLQLERAEDLLKGILIYNTFNAPAPAEKVAAK